MIRHLSIFLVLILIFICQESAIAQRAAAQTKEEMARGLYNQALLATDPKTIDTLLNRVISEFPDTVAATEAIKLRVEREKAARLAQVMADLAEKQSADAKAALAAELIRKRSEALGGFTISELAVHELRVPIPNKSI